MTHNTTIYDDNGERDDDISDFTIPDPPSPKKVLDLLDEVMSFADNYKELQPVVQDLITSVEKFRIKEARQSDIRHFLIRDISLLIKIIDRD